MNCPLGQTTNNEYARQSTRWPNNLVRIQIKQTATSHRKLKRKSKIIKHNAVLQLPNSYHLWDLSK